MNLIPRKFYLDDVFDDFFVSSEKNNMKCDIYEKEGKYFIEMDLPGFNKEDINIDMDNNYLTISAEKNSEEEDNSKNYIKRERFYNKYQRSFYVGNVSENLIDAKFDKSTLTVIIPIEEEKNKKQIEIK